MPPAAGPAVAAAQPALRPGGVRRAAGDRDRDDLVQLAPCNARLHRVAEAVKRGAWQAGGFPPEFPVMVTGETLMRPTAMFCRNLLAMEAEELIGPADDGSAAAGRAREYWPGE